MSAYTIIRNYPVDTSLFTANQMHARTIMSMGMNHSWDWFLQQGVSFPRFVSEFKQGMVVLGVDIEYLAPFKFLDAPIFEARSLPVNVSRHGLQLEFGMDIFSNETMTIRSRSICAVLALSGDEALGATAGVLRPPLMALFKDEQLKKMPLKINPSALIKQLVTTPAVLEHRHAFQVYRHQCEVADQWCFIEVPGWISEARESALLKTKDLDMRRLLHKTIKRLTIKYARPMYFTDQGELMTRAYRLDERVFFVHEVFNLTQKTSAALAIEEF